MTNEQIDKMVLYLMSRHVGKNNRIERWTLVERVFGISIPMHERNDDNPHDRDVRESVFRLRNQGHLICDLGDGLGRWVADSKAEFAEFYRYFVKPISSKAATARAMKKSAERKFPNKMQPGLWDAPQEEVEVLEDFDDVLEVTA